MNVPSVVLYCSPMLNWTLDRLNTRTPFDRYEGYCPTYIANAEVGSKGKSRK